MFEKLSKRIWIAKRRKIEKSVIAKALEQLWILRERKYGGELYCINFMGCSIKNPMADRDGTKDLTLMRLTKPNEKVRKKLFGTSVESLGSLMKNSEFNLKLLERFERIVA